MIKLDELIKSSVYITPNFPDITTKRYKFTFYQVLAAVSTFSCVIAILTILFLIITPADKIAFIFENEAVKEQAERVRFLEKKVNFLTRELENISSKNRKLKYALLLGSGDSLKDKSIIYDSLKSIKKVKKKSSNNILMAFTSFLQEMNTSVSNNKIIFLSPVKGYINNEYSDKKGHFGIDYASPVNTPIKAAASGYVISSDFIARDGNVIKIKHSNDYITVYKHCSVLLKKERDRVDQGEIIGYTGNSGYNTSGPHLHFEIWKAGKIINPRKLLVDLE